jgi:hypothetical protein
LPNDNIHFNHHDDIGPNDDDHDYYDHDDNFNDDHDHPDDDNYDADDYDNKFVIVKHIHKYQHHGGVQRNLYLGLDGWCDVVL